MPSLTVRYLGVISLFAAAPACLNGDFSEKSLNVGTVQQAVTVSPGGLVQLVDYSDTFTLGGTRTDGLYNDNRAGAYGVESDHAVVWTPTTHFSFNSPSTATNPALVRAAGGNSGAATGLAQSGADDFSITYGRRTNYTVQVDAILPTDRLDISSLSSSGATIYDGHSLSVFFRRDGVGLPGIGVFNGTTEKDTGISTGIIDNNWHNFAVNFDQASGHLRLFVDGALRGDLDLTTFAGGAYRSYSNAAVGVGGNGSVLWVDNFIVGAPSLMQRAAYSDSFTLNTVRTDRLYNDNSAGAYSVEVAPAPGATWQPQSHFSFNTPASSTNPTLLAAASGNPGAATGLAQSGDDDFSVVYSDPSLSYVVQADAIIPRDRFDISSLPSAGATIYAGSSLSVFFRRDGGALPDIGLFNGTKEKATGCATGITDQNWHNFAVSFEQDRSHVRMFVDRVQKCDIDLASFDGGAFKTYAKAAVGMGGTASVTWMDNFQAGPGWMVHTTGALAGGEIGTLFNSQGAKRPPLSKTRGVGTIPDSCGDGDEKDGALCYPVCAAGYDGVGPLCWGHCPSGYTDTGALCTYSAGPLVVALECHTTGSFPFVSCDCPSNYTNTGVACAANTVAKSSYGRGAGTVLSCSAGLEKDAGLCYSPCPTGYKGVGPVCWIDGFAFDDLFTCRGLFDSSLAQNAQSNGKTMTYGFGGGVSAFATTSYEAGVAYGPSGEYGCYKTACWGIVTDVSLSAWGAFGQLAASFDELQGSSRLEVVGGTFDPFKLGGTVGTVYDSSGKVLGFTESVSLGLGLSPILKGGLSCQTWVNKLW